MADSWKAPSAVIGIISLILTAANIVFGFFQYQWSEQLEREKLTLEQSKVMVTNQIEEEKRRWHQEKIDNIDNELAEIDSEIQECREKIGSATMRVRVLMNRDANDETIAAMEEAKVIAERYNDKWKELEKKKEKLEDKKRDL